MDPALCQISLWCYRCSRSSARVNIATSALAQRLILRRGAQHLPFSLHLSLVTHLPPQVLDTHRNGLSAVQLNILVVCPRTCRLISRQIVWLTSNPCQGNYYIAFVILTTALEDYISQLHYLNLVLNYFYLGLLITCFLLSLGNRPQGAKWAYTLAFVGFGLITIYMTVCLHTLSCWIRADFVIDLSIPSRLEGHRGRCQVRGSCHPG